MNEPKWINWARGLISVSQTGLYYAKNIEEKSRYNLVKDIAFDMISNFSNIDKENLMVMFDKAEGYSTPQVTVRAVIINEGDLLLVKEGKNGLWNLPGGYAEVNLSPSESIIKEVKEECGILIRPTKLLAVYQSKHKQVQHRYNLFFKCELVEEYIENYYKTEEISKVKFVEFDKITQLPLNDYLIEQLKKLEKHFNDNNLETEFC